MNTKETTSITKIKSRHIFARLFWRRLLVILLVTGILFGAGLWLFCTKAKQQQDDSFRANLGARAGYVYIRENENEARFADTQRYHNCSYSRVSGIPSLLYDTNTGEVIADCDSRIFVLIPQDRDATDPSSPALTLTYSYPTADIPGWTEFIQIMAGENANYVSAIEMPYLYTDDENIIPGPFTLQLYDEIILPHPEGDKAYQEVVASYTFEEPSEIPEGYRLQRMDVKPYSVYPPVLIGNVPNNSLLDFGYAWFDGSYALLQEVYGECVNQKLANVNSRKETFFTLEMAASVEKELKNGRRVTLMSALQYDILKVYGRTLLWVTAGLLLLDVLIALLWTYLSGTRIQARYAMEDYRRNLTNTLAHDLKSPLMSISGYAENLRENTTPDKQAHYTDAILENVNYMNQIIESVLSLSKLESNSGTLCKESLDMKELVEQYLKKYECRIEEKHLVTELRGDMNLKADRQLIAQMLDNLLGNAIKYAPCESVIQIVMGVAGLTVRNRCDNDLSDLIDRLCEPFVTGDRNRSNKSGNGLGLSIAKTICDLHGLSLRVAYRDGEFEARIFIG